MLTKTNDLTFLELSSVLFILNIFYVYDISFWYEYLIHQLSLLKTLL